MNVDSTNVLMQAAVTLRASVEMICYALFYCKEIERKFFLAFSAERLGVILRSVLLRTEEIWSNELDPVDYLHLNSPSISLNNWEFDISRKLIDELEHLNSLLPNHILLAHDRATLVNAIEQVRLIGPCVIHELKLGPFDFKKFAPGSVIPVAGRPREWTEIAEPLPWGSNHSDIFSDNSNMRNFFNFVYADVEISAMEVCAASICTGDEMPGEFVCDLSRQIGDEARHAIAFRNMLVETGGNPDCISYTRRTHKRYFSGRTLSERMVIQHLIQEGDAVETSFMGIEALIELGHQEWADQWRVINRDEAYHVIIGNRWLSYIIEKYCADFNHEYTKIFRAAAAQSRIYEGTSPPWTPQIRGRLRFPKHFIVEQAALRISS